MLWLSLLALMLVIAAAPGVGLYLEHLHSPTHSGTDHEPPQTV